MVPRVVELQAPTSSEAKWWVVDQDEYEMLKNSYEELQKFKKKHNKIVSIEEQEKIKKVMEQD